MKKIILFVCFLCIKTLIFAQISPFSYVFKGKIDGKYEIEIYFSDNENSNVSGYYFYTNTLAPIALEGKWIAGKSLVLEYKDYSDPKNSEKFAFDKPDFSKELTGTWTKGTKNLKVALQNISKSFTQKNLAIFGEGVNKIWEKSDINKDFLADGFTTPFFVDKNGKFLLNENHNFQKIFHSESILNFENQYTGAGRMDMLKIDFRLLTANTVSILRSIYTNNYYSDPDSEEVTTSLSASLSVWQKKGNDWVNVTKEVLPADFSKNVGIDVLNSTDWHLSDETVELLNLGTDKVFWVKKDKKRQIFEWVNEKFVVK